MTMFRWPERECFHYNIAFSLAINLVSGEAVRSVPVRCVDCGAEFEDE